MNESIEKRALYNLLRRHWLGGEKLSVEPWQIENYRDLPLQDLFERLSHFNIHLDSRSFEAYAEACDSPEDLTDALTAEISLNAKDQDKIYLIIFELWRRLMSEKPSPSIYCDELDHQISLYDENHLVESEPIQEALSNILVVLEENVDAGVEGKEAFQRLASYCANDVEAFLYDYISDQIESDNELYAQGLIKDFTPYFEDTKWFSLLQAQLFYHINAKQAESYLVDLVEEQKDNEDLEFNLALLSLIALYDQNQLFQTVKNASKPLIKSEEDFQDLLAICSELAERSEDISQQRYLNSLIEKRAYKSLSSVVEQNDKDLVEFFSKKSF